MKPRECEAPGCVKTFIPLKMGQRACGPFCGLKIARAIRKKKEEAEKESLKARKAALKRIPDLIKEAQREFNLFVRTRDAGKLCICCGRPLGGEAVGGAFDAGHWRSTGSAPHLRFNENNCHGQLKFCNRYGAGRAVDFRRGLIERLGLEAVEALEADNRVHKWTREELIEIKTLYKAKAKALQDQLKEKV